MSYIDESLSAGERIEGLVKLHWFAWVHVGLWFILGFVTFGITWLLAVIAFLRNKYLEQGVTNKRVIVKKGVISRKTDEMQLKAIETIEIKQGMIGRIFGFGVVKITGRGASNVIFTYVDDPMSVKRQIENIGNPVAIPAVVAEDPR